MKEAEKFLFCRLLRFIEVYEIKMCVCIYMVSILGEF